MTDKLVVLISGANKGIGYQVAKLFAGSGTITYIGSRNEALGLKAKEELSKDLPNADIRVIKLELGNIETVKLAVDKITKETGKLDYLINNAAVALGYGKPSQYDPEILRKTYDINFFGTVELTQFFIPLLRKGNEKVIVNVSSDLGSLQLQNYGGFKHNAVNFLSYNTSKTALNAFTVVLSKELAAEGFRINSVNPGFTKTDLNRNTGERTPEYAGKIVYEAAIKQHGTGRFLGEDYTIHPW
ncbi:short-chain dehydrogenase/reductase (SDR) family protein [Tieghemostelium lacteum]|uniref:Short-chain dehydrogenase/reductase (SDR) family protein n=1 Tax=Tieghemostelium lacteum TaxID=361077 RepID=A0A151ZDU2_TIELA|nr:short-chain dehydrogenase/reductase (SDR) family protein [Tieghemostelium lacteum]|eukprot:KYQ92111.1 short-chain dehydrogenase/reductase (SDR) family protein [Tieghemostelium lacteum]